MNNKVEEEKLVTLQSRAYSKAKCDFLFVMRKITRMILAANL